MDPEPTRRVRLMGDLPETTDQEKIDSSTVDPEATRRVRLMGDLPETTDREKIDSSTRVACRYRPRSQQPAVIVRLTLHTSHLRIQSLSLSHAELSRAENAAEHTPS